MQWNKAIHLLCQWLVDNKAISDIELSRLREIHIAFFIQLMSYSLVALEVFIDIYPCTYKVNPITGYERLRL